MKDRTGRIIYVGKAINLKKRVRSYFTGNREVKTRVLVGKIESLEHIVTRNEYEALVLENNLIKKWSPRYNINLKDGKSYPVIRITSEPFPRVFRTRRIIRDGSSYFGPYAHVRMLDVYLQAIDTLYPLRKCKGSLKKRENPCLYYHIGACTAPCCGKVTREEYAERVEAIKRLLAGGAEGLAKEYRRRMKESSESLDFEGAARFRDILRSIEEVTSTQEVQDFNEEIRDYHACVHDGELFTFVVFQMRGGKLTGRELYNTESSSSEDDALVDFLFQFYQNAGTLPSRIFLDLPLPSELLAEYFRREYGKKVEIAFPKKGRHLSILRMARENALLELERRIGSRDRTSALRDLKTALSLPRLPSRIEGFDIAQLGGTNPVASLVSFKNGRPDKGAYRRFRLKTLGGEIDDFESMREVIARRYTRVLNEGLERPDLILVDGGKGQVSAAVEILTALGLADIPVAGLAKKNEEIFLPGKTDPIVFPEGNDSLRILQAVRDEAHRFATTLQKRLREKDMRTSSLEGVSGVGKVRAAKLLDVYGSVDALSRANSLEVAEKTGIPLSTAERIIEYFHDKNLTTDEK